jgi:non-specific protein-tyrosine kinase
MEIRQYIEPLFKWWKLIVVACVLAAISSYLVVRQQPPIYQTQSALVIGRAVYEPNPSGGELGLAQQLATYYANIALRDVVRTGTMNALNLTWLPNYTVSAVPNSQIIEIVVTDTDPLRAQAVANELANQLIKQSPSNPDLQEQKHQEFIRQQINLLEAQIQDTLDEIASKEAELGSLNSARQISQTQAEIAGLQQKLTTLQTNYAALLNSSSGQGMNSLSLLESAALPQRPIGPNRAMIILMSVAIAFLISAGAAYLIEYLDDTFENADEINKHLNLPVIGFVPEITKDGEKNDLVVRDGHSVEAEAFRALRVNIDFLQVHSPVKTLLVVSVGKTEGKSVISTNLALAIARSGKKVILLDADLRRPSLHQYLDLPNETGLSNIFLGHTGTEDLIQSTDQENLSVITTGTPPPNPGELIGLKLLDDFLHELSSRADIVIVDGPPVLVTDATILSAKVDAVLLVVGYGRTRRSEAVVAMRQLERAGAKIVGVVFNRVPDKKQGFYRLYPYDYGMEAEATPSKVFQLGKIRIPLHFRAPNLKMPKAETLKRSSEVEHSEPIVDKT